MRQRNHCSSLKGIPKMKLQGSGPSTPKSLQSQNRPRPENRLSISRLDVVHGQLRTILRRGESSGAGAEVVCDEFFANFGWACSHTVQTVVAHIKDLLSRKPPIVQC